MFGAMLIAQITVISLGPPLSPEEAVRVLRASRSTADMTDVHLGPVPDVPAPAVRSTWRPGEGPFGRFDDRLTRLDLLRRGSDRWIHVGYDARGHYHAPSLPAIFSRGSRSLTSKMVVHSVRWRRALDSPRVIPLPRGYRGVPLTSPPLRWK